MRVHSPSLLACLTVCRAALWLTKAFEVCWPPALKNSSKILIIIILLKVNTLSYLPKRAVLLEIKGSFRNLPGISAPWCVAHRMGPQNLSL